MRSQGQRHDRQFADVCSAITLVAAAIVFTIGGYLAVTQCERINAEKEVKLAQIVVGRTTVFDFRMQIDSRQVTKLDLPHPAMPQSPRVGAMRPLAR